MSIETYQSPDWTVITTERLKALEAEVTGLRGLVRAVASETDIPMEEIEQQLSALKELECDS